MPIQIACPECGKKYRFPDERAGSAVDCKECGAEIELPGGGKRRAKSRDDDDVQTSPKRRPGKSGRSSKKSKSGSNTGLMIGGGIGAVVVIGVLVVFLMRPGNKPQTVAGDSATPNGSAPNAAAGTAGSTPAAPTVVAKGWKAKIDPPAVPYPADQVTSFKIDVKGTSGLSPKLITYPDVTSPFALIGDAGSAERPRELWNLATGLKVRDITPSKRSPYRSGLSPDGKLLAWYRHDEGGGLDVYDMDADKILVSIPLPSAQINVASVSLPTNQRLVITSNVHRKVMTWKLPSGEAERTITLGENAQPSDFLAFSPGGQYLAFTGDFLTRSLQVYDLNSGELAGTIEFSEPMSVSNKSLIGLDFSPDGKELAAAFGQNHGATSDRVLIWNVADGATVADFSLPDPDQRPIDIGGARPSLQWFPDRKRLLQNGQHVIDRDARKVVFSLPPPSLNYNSGLVRRVLSNSVIAAFEGVKDTGTLTSLELKESDVARAREIASSGGLVIDARLPKLTSFDRKRAADKTAIDTNWKVQPDPGPNPATLVASIPLSDTKGWVRELEFSRLDPARAALRLADGEDTTKAVLHLAHPRVVPVEGAGRVRRRYAFAPVTCRQNWLELFDLAQGKSVGRVEIGFPCELVALSPNGSRALVAPMEGQGRLDVFSVPEGTHLAGCRPFGDAAKPEHRDIEAAVFLDENTIAACSRNDQLVVFKLPGCDPVYAVQDAGLVTLSPGGKLLATCAEGKIEFRDALTGDGRGSAQLAGEQVALSFSPKGDRLAVLTAGNSGSQLNVIELKDGTMSNMSIPAALSPLLWVGDQQVLVGAEKASDLILNKTVSNTIDRYMMLVDVRRQTVLWSYDYGTKDRVTFGRSTVDGRLWVAGAAKRGGALKLTALALPEPSITARLDDKALDAQVAVKPGMTVSLQFGLTDPPELSGFAQQVRGLVDGAVRNNGLNIKDGQPITLVASATVANAPGTMQLQTLTGTTNKPPATVNLQPKNLTIRMAYESNGKTLWESKQVVSNASTGLVMFDTKSPQRAVDELMWKQAVDMFRLAQPPSSVLAGATIRGLGTSRLSGDGAYPPE